MIKYRPEIDGLRAIAVLAVVIFHAEFYVGGVALLKGGFIGVDVFFVISGYLITSIIMKDINEGRFSYAQFYERRARRILPALFATILLSAPFAYWLLLASQLRSYVYSIFSALGFSSNVYFSLQDSYWAAPNLLEPFLHTWSLSVEEQFYIFFPLLLIFVLRFKKQESPSYTNVSFSTKPETISKTDGQSVTLYDSNDLLENVQINGFSRLGLKLRLFIGTTFESHRLLITLFSILIISLLTSQITSSMYPKLAFYLLPTRAWELMAGAIVAVLPSLQQRKTNKFFAILPDVGFFLVLLSLFYFDQTTPHPSIITAIPILGVFLFIYFANLHSFCSRLIAHRFFVAIGLVSYSFYLIHYPLFAFLRITEHMNTNIEKFAASLSALVIAIFFYIFIEQPFRKKGNVSLKAFLSWLVIILSLILITMVFFFYHISILEKGNSEVQSIANVGFQELYDSEARRCHNRDPSSPCVFTANDNASTQYIALLGDSHAGSIAYFVKEMADTLNLNFAQFTIDSCAFIPGIILDNNIRKERCNSGQDHIKKFLAEHPDTIVIYLTRWPHHILDSGGYNYKEGIDKQYELKKWIEYLHNNSAKLIVIESIPQFPYNVRDKFINLALSRSVQDTLSTLKIPIEKYNSYASTANKILNDSISYSDVQIISPQKLFCHEKSCQAERNSKLLYYDHGHLSEHGAKLLLRTLVQQEANAHVSSEI